MICVHVSEECGYRHWRWDYPGSHNDLIADWKAAVAPLSFFDPSEGNFKGTMTEVTGEEYDAGLKEQRRAGGPVYRAHVHMPDDTFLNVSYRSPHWRLGDDDEPATTEGDGEARTIETAPP